MNKLKRLATTCGLILPTISILGQQKPNIIFIYADDMGYSDLQCYGSKVNTTPNLDRMAEEGMRFTDFYASAPVSTPSRAGLMTGRYATRMGIRHVFFENSFTGMPQSEITIAEMLKPEGYTSAIYGKWHLGTYKQFLPLHQGFDEFYGTFCSIDNPPFVYVDGDEPQSKLANKDSTTIVYTNKAVNFIDRNKDKQFFLYVPYNMPHVPLGASPRFRGKSRNGLYGDAIEELDWGVGEIIKEVDKLGLTNNTIICFASDNGPWLSQGPYGGCALPLFRGKGTTWDGGQRVPMIVRWPGHIKAGKVEKHVASMVDWFPTFAAITGGEVPTDRQMDGENILPVLLGTSNRPNEEFAYITSRPFSNSVVSAYRDGDWKLKLPEGAVRGNYWETDLPAHETELFNLRKDISEQHNVSAEHPEIVKTLLAKIDSLNRTGVIKLPQMFQFEFQTDALTDKQRQDNTLNAYKKGILPKSENGKAVLEYYQDMEKFQKKHGSLF